MRLRHSPPRPWQPLSDEEYAALLPHLPPSGGPGRPPADRRRTLDAIFWIACSRGPWRDLPPELGRADSAHRTLRRWARAGVLDRLLTALSGRAWAPAPPALRAMEYWICRAWRRMARLMSVGSLLLARRLGLLTALPCAPVFLPNPDLSETLRRLSLRVLGEPAAWPRGTLALIGRALLVAGGQPRRFRLC